LLPDPNHIDAAAVLHAPSLAHWLGTDALGRDVLARLIARGETTLAIALPAAALAWLLAVAYGLAAAAAPRWLAAIMLRTLDAVLALPGLVVLLVFASLLPPGWAALVLLIGATGWPPLARLVRNEAIALQSRDFVLASRQLGGNWRWVARVHLLPAMAGFLAVNAALLVADSVLGLSALSFLGLGVQPPASSWGQMLQQGLDLVDLNAWWLILPPGLAILATVLAARGVGARIVRPGALPADPVTRKRAAHDGDSSANPMDSRPRPAGGLEAQPPAGSTGRAPGLPALALRDLTITLPRAGRILPVLEAFCLAIEAGEMVAVVGESGSGKSLAAMSVPLLLPPGAQFSGGIWVNGQDVASLTPRGLRQLRGARVGVVFQDPLGALNPARRVGAQLAEPMMLHRRMTRAAAWAEAEALLAEVGIDQPSLRAQQYPHQLSGGMRQRAGIAMALACRPALLIADEPTTGLDPVLARQILDLLDRLRRDRGLAVLLVSHDLALVRRHADRVHVLYAGRTVEHGPAAAVLTRPGHPYTAGLLDASPPAGRMPRAIPGTVPEPEAWPPGCRFAPRCPVAGPACAESYPPELAGETTAACLIPGAVDGGWAQSEMLLLPPPGGEVLRVERLSVRYGAYLALSDINFSLRRGEALAVVGPSGSGKTTLGRAVLQMFGYEGAVVMAGQGLSRWHPLRRRLQVVFQDPLASLNPALRVFDTLAEAFRLGGRTDAMRGRAAAALAQVGLDAALLDRFPATLSGGQAQRVAVARALAAQPDVIVLDEPTASLDSASRANLLALLRDLAGRTGVAYLVITHDLAVAAALARRIAVIEQGKIVEIADTDAFLARPTSEAGRAWVSAWVD
jgi:oligopeptide/dipeptide ABC transporter ATP-binding protein